MPPLYGWEFGIDDRSRVRSSRRFFGLDGKGDDHVVEFLRDSLSDRVSERRGHVLATLRFGVEPRCGSEAWHNFLVVRNRIEADSISASVVRVRRRCVLLGRGMVGERTRGGVGAR